MAYVPTGKLYITFTESRILSEVTINVTICGLSFLVYLSRLPVMQCYNCSLHYQTKSLINGCNYCNSLDHISSDRICVENADQKIIKNMMSLENQSYTEAIKRERERE